MKNGKKIFAGILMLVLLLTINGNSPRSVASAKKIKINKSSITLTVGQTKKLKVTGTKKKIKWTSNNKAAASVNSKGKITAKAVGNAVITAKVSGKKLRCKVCVKPKLYAFQKMSDLADQYQENGVQMGYSSDQAYLAGANRIIQNPASLHKLKKDNGDHVYFLEASNEVVFLSKHGFIRTYFRADGGIDYYNRI